MSQNEILVIIAQFCYFTENHRINLNTLNECELYDM